MMILLHWFMTVAGVVGTVWYISSSMEFWPILVYFLTLSTVGSLVAIASYFRYRSLFLLAGGLSGIAIGLLVALQVAAFTLSLGSGAAAIPFVVVSLAINMISLRWISAQIKG